MQALRRLAFPDISTGAYGDPKAAAARITIDRLRTFLDQNVLAEVVIFCCFNADNATLDRSLLSD